MVLGIVLALMGVWVVVPHLRLVAEDGPVRLFAGLALGAFALGYVPATGVIETLEPVRLWRRFAAFLIDLVALFMVLDPVLSGLNEFWGAIIGVTLVFCYFWLHPRFARATLGQTIMAYRIVPAEDASNEPEFALRTVTGFAAVCLWPITVIAASQKDSVPGAYYWDRETGTQAVMVVGLGR